MSDIDNGVGGGSTFDQGYPYGTNAPRPSLQSPLSKSWLFEIVNRESDVVVESFTLVLPPNAYTIKEPQRVAIQKTFGNAFVDDYGPDNLEITIKGITGTTHAFPTFSTRGNRSNFTDVAAAISGASAASDNTEGYTGQTAFYEFRNKIMRYKNKSGWDKNELHVYDLADEQSYKCVLLNFTVDRSSERPFHYPYTISLFVYARLDGMSTLTSDDAINVAKDPIAALDDADRVLESIQTAYQDVTEVINRVSLMKTKSLELRTRYNRFLNQTTRTITSPLDLTKNLIEIGVSSISILYDTYTAGKYTFERFVGANELFRSILIQALKAYGFQISQGWLATNTVDLEADAGIDTSGTSVARQSSIASYEYSGLNVYTVKGEDTLQRIAQNELGDESLWAYIAAVNSNITSNDDLTPGIEIFVPIQVDITGGVNKELFVLTEDVARDPYGTDIEIDSNGNIVILESSDFALVSGLANVRQAIDLRLNTVAGSLIKQTAFGISSRVGVAGTELSLKYLKMAIRNALVQDSRIESVENMVVSLSMDKVFISMQVNIIGAESSLPVEVPV